MFRLTTRFVIDRPIADVWRFLADLPRVATWEQGVLEVRQTSTGAPGLGTTLVVRHTYFGCAVLIDCRITEWEVERGCTMALEGGPIRRASVRYAVESVRAEQTAVTYTGEGEMIRALRFLEPVAPAMGRATERKNLARLKRLLEASDHEASTTAPA